MTFTTYRRSIGRSHYELNYASVASRRPRVGRVAADSVPTLKLNAKQRSRTEHRLTLLFRVQLKMVPLSVCCAFSSSLKQSVLICCVNVLHVLERMEALDERPELHCAANAAHTEQNS